MNSFENAHFKYIGTFLEIIYIYVDTLNNYMYNINIVKFKEVPKWEQ